MWFSPRPYAIGKRLLIFVMLTEDLDIPTWEWPLKPCGTEHVLPHCICKVRVLIPDSPNQYSTLTSSFRSWRRLAHRLAKRHRAPTSPFKYLGTPYKSCDFPSADQIDYSRHFKQPSNSGPSDKGQASPPHPPSSYLGMFPNAPHKGSRFKCCMGTGVQEFTKVTVLRSQSVRSRSLVAGVPRAGCTARASPVLQHPATIITGPLHQVWDLSRS